MIFNIEIELLWIYVLVDCFYIIFLIKEIGILVIDCVIIIDLVMESEIFLVNVVIGIDLVVDFIKMLIKYWE